MYKNINPSYRGKVRDVFDLGDSLILVSTDRISAFDVVFDEPIPGKGEILNRVSLLWFNHFSDIPNHLIESDSKKFPSPYSEEEWLQGRSIWVKKCKRIDYECVVRGYISGSAYKEYVETGNIAFVSYPPGIRESEKLPHPIFTPARKNDRGHDENISEETMKKEIGEELFTKLKEKSLYIFSRASGILEENGILLADTKFEFGLWNDEVILIDEILTPDSSRYWSKESYAPGTTPPSMDKQILRNYLLQTGWNKNPPPPSIPVSIQNQIMEQYKQLEKKVELCLLQK